MELTLFNSRFDYKIDLEHGHREEFNDILASDKFLAYLSARNGDHIRISFWIFRRTYMGNHFVPVFLLKVWNLL